MSELPEAIIEAGAIALYDGPWVDEWPLPAAKAHYRTQAERILRAALSVTSTEGPQLILGEQVAAVDVVVSLDEHCEEQRHLEWDAAAAAYAHSQGFKVERVPVYRATNWRSGTMGDDK